MVEQHSWLLSVYACKALKTSDGAEKQVTFAKELCQPLLKHGRSLSMWRTTYPHVLAMSCLLVENHDTGRKDRRVAQRYRPTKYITLLICLTAPLTLQHFIHAQNKKLQDHKHVQALSRLRGINSISVLLYSVRHWRLPTAAPVHSRHLPPRTTPGWGRPAPPSAPGEGQQTNAPAPVRASSPGTERTRK